MKKQIFFYVLFFLSIVNTSFASVKGFFKDLKDNGDLKVGVGVNYYMVDEKHGESEKKFSPIASLGYQYNFKNNIFISANVNYDAVELTSKALFSDIEVCDLEDVMEGECANVGAYKSKAEGQDIDYYRLADINIGYNFKNGFSVFAGVSYYQIDYKYKNISFEGLNSASLTDFYHLDPIDDGDDDAFGFGIGAYYNIKNTNFSTKLMYNTVSFDGGNLDAGGKQKITEHKISFSIIYNFL